ncbi:TPA: hypothetical protein ACHGJG_005147 [Escherichia coli]|uniref:Uncharacterized protein n=1 Tax=Bacillus phage Sole TaxID=1260287 RepID=A0A8E8PBF6_9VIRU|nr:hypothetical protein [Bacillus cereus]YP_010771373.1 hypothetical protein QIM33_gp03 [Bacillus phage Sole]EJR71077.1 hypothetical protein IK9_06087 [Bacillus cereus VD166]QWE49655.1 hypothetical protein Sole_gp03 [Bacillus phage Sole]
MDKPLQRKRFVLENGERTLVFEEKDNGLYSISEGLEQNYHVVSISRSEFLVAFEMLIGDVL